MLRSEAPPRRADDRTGRASPHWVGIAVSLGVHGAAIAGILGVGGATRWQPPVAIPVELVVLAEHLPPTSGDSDRDAESRQDQLPSDDFGRLGVAEAEAGQRAESAPPVPPAALVEPAAAEAAKSAAAPAPAQGPPPAAAKVAPLALALDAAGPPPPLPRAKPPVPARPPAPPAAGPATEPRSPAQAPRPKPSTAAALPQDEPSPESPAMAERRTPAPSRHEMANLSPAAPGDGQREGGDDAAGNPPRYRDSGFSNPPPRYPYLARRRGQEGRVTLRVQVTAGGEAAAVSVQRSSGYPLLDEAAVEAVRSWRFVPARRDGTQVAGAVDVPIAFKLTGR